MRQNKKVEPPLVEMFVPYSEQYDRNRYFAIADFSNLTEKNKNVTEEIYDVFNVEQPTGLTMEIEKDRYENEKLASHPDGNATQDEINQAKQDGYVLNDDWKTQFTIKAYHECRRVKQVVHEVAVEFRDGIISWDPKDRIRVKSNESLSAYFNKLNRINHANFLKTKKKADLIQLK